VCVWGGNIPKLNLWNYTWRTESRSSLYNRNPTVDTKDTALSNDSERCSFKISLTETGKNFNKRHWLRRDRKHLQNVDTFGAFVLLLFQYVKQVNMFNKALII